MELKFLSSTNQQTHIYLEKLDSLPMFTYSANWVYTTGLKRKSIFQKKVIFLKFIYLFSPKMFTIYDRLKPANLSGTPECCLLRYDYVL